jgi:hypothetical protein
VSAGDLEAPEARCDEADARRWRWISQQFRCQPDMGGNHRWFLDYIGCGLTGRSIEQAVDAAMQRYPGDPS